LRRQGARKQNCRKYGAVDSRLSSTPALLLAPDCQLVRGSREPVRSIVQRWSIS